MKNPVGWFEIPVTDLDRAEKFYNELLGFEFDRQDPKPNGITMSFFPMEMDALGCPGTLVLGPNFVPSQEGSLVYFSTANVEETVKKIMMNNEGIELDEILENISEVVEDLEDDIVNIESASGDNVRIFIEK